jgi:hypothetical protein
LKDFILHGIFVHIFHRYLSVRRDFEVDDLMRLEVELGISENLSEEV